jgi:DNA-binding HxlR family transcriptional regulator
MKAILGDAPANGGYNAMLAGCPTREVLNALSDKWVGLVIVSLADGALRYSEIARTVEGVSQKMLSQTLRSLERNGMITRTVTPSTPIRVDYELTRLGAELLPILQAVKTFSEANIDNIRVARVLYDLAG